MSPPTPPYLYSHHPTPTHTTLPLLTPPYPYSHHPTLLAPIGTSSACIGVAAYATQSLMTAAYAIPDLQLLPETNYTWSSVGPTLDGDLGRCVCVCVGVFVGGLVCGWVGVWMDGCVGGWVGGCVIRMDMGMSCHVSHVMSCQSCMSLFHLVYRPCHVVHSPLSFTHQSSVTLPPIPSQNISCTLPLYSPCLRIPPSNTPLIDASIMIPLQPSLFSLSNPPSTPPPPPL